MCFCVSSLSARSKAPRNKCPLEKLLMLRALRRALMFVSACVMFGVIAITVSSNQLNASCLNEGMAEMF